MSLLGNVEGYRRALQCGLVVQKSGIRNRDGGWNGSGRYEGRITACSLTAARPYLHVLTNKEEVSAVPGILEVSIQA